MCDDAYNSRLFRKMPFTQKHVATFAQLLTSIVLGYVKIVNLGIDKQLSAEAAKAEHWGYSPDPVIAGKLVLSLPTTLLVRMNNVWVSKKMLSSLLENAKLESAWAEAVSGSAGQIHGEGGAVHTGRRKSMDGGATGTGTGTGTGTTAPAAAAAKKPAADDDDGMLS